MALRPLPSYIAFMQQGALQSSRAGPVSPGRFVVGVLLHLIVPAYLVTVTIAWFADPPAVGSRVALLHALIALSVRFLAVYGAAIIAMGLIAIAAERLRHRRARRVIASEVPERVSLERFETVLAEGGRALVRDPDGRAAAALAALRSEPLDHTDARVQKLVEDAHEAIRAFALALATAPAARRAELADVAADTLHELARAAHTLAADHGLRAEGAARTVARYIQLRYGDNPELESSGSHAG